jgi:osmoprotectant transport system substrate-binding protein
LTDDKEFFPNYAPVLVVRSSILEANPNLEKTLNDLSAKLTNEVM